MPGRDDREEDHALERTHEEHFYIAIALMVIGVVIFYADFFDQHRHIGFWSSTFGGLLLTAGATMKGV